MNKYSVLLDFLQSQEEYQVDARPIRARAHTFPDIKETKEIYVIPKQRAEKSGNISKDLIMDNKQQEKIRHLIVEGTGFVHSQIQEASYSGRSETYPQLTYIQELEPTQATVKWTDVSGKKHEKELQGKNTLEILVKTFA